MASIMDLKRMCKEHFKCEGCPFIDFDCCEPDHFPDNADEIADKWVAEHPIKTYAMDFFEKFPDAQRKATTGIPIPCIRVIYSEFYDKDCPVGRCSECWNREMKEDD
jgi:hypothetical protein